MYEITVLDLEDISSNKQASSEWNLLFKVYSRSLKKNYYEALGKLTCGSGKWGSRYQEQSNRIRLDRIIKVKMYSSFLETWNFSLQFIYTYKMTYTLEH